MLKSDCQNIATTYFVFAKHLPCTCICDFPSSFSILPIKLQPFNTTSIRSQGLEIPSHRKACRQEPDSPKTEALRFVPFEIYFLSLETKLRKLTSLKGTCLTVESEVWNHLFPLLLPSGPRLVNLKGWSGKTTCRWLWTPLKTFPVLMISSWLTCMWRNDQSEFPPCVPQLPSAGTTEEKMNEK